MSDKPQSTWVITGGASGIGLTLARRLHRAGAAVLIWDLQEPPEDVGTYIETDLCDREAVRRAAERVGDTLTCLAHLAGVRTWGRIDDAGLVDMLDRQIAVSCRGFVTAVQALLAPLIAAKGSIVAVTSIGADLISDGNLTYGVGKAALRRVLKGLAVELGVEGVRVNDVAPGATRTPFNTTRGIPEREAARKRAIPLGDQAQPEQIAAVIEFLASPAASHVNGVTLPVDGGVTAALGTLISPELGFEPKRLQAELLPNQL